jgi:2-dehydropantoate 2-reductase
VHLGLCVQSILSISRTATFAPNSRRFSTMLVRVGPLHSEKPSVAIVGSGAVGGYYGARLWECGAYDVKFHMRGEHYAESMKSGLKLASIHGDIFIPADELQAFTDTRDIGKVDWVIVALKSTALTAIPALISPLLEPRKTKVLAIMNGLIEADLIQLLKDYNGEDTSDVTQHVHCCGALYGGMAFLCSNRLGPGSINHTYAGSLSGGVAAHAPDTTTDEALDAYRQFWRRVEKVDTNVEDSLLRGRWRKNVWNLPFNGISVALRGITVDKIVNDPDLRALADKIMDETIATANADLKRNGWDESFYLGDKDKKQMFALSDDMGPYKTSTMIDLVERNPMEVQYLFREPVIRAKELGVPVCHLETLLAQIGALQRFYNLF